MCIDLILPYQLKLSFPLKLQVLDEEAEVFVVKMWRLLIYEIEAKKLGLVCKPDGITQVINFYYLFFTFIAF